MKKYFIILILLLVTNISYGGDISFANNVAVFEDTWFEFTSLPCGPLTFEYNDLYSSWDYDFKEDKLIFLDGDFKNLETLINNKEWFNNLDSYVKTIMICVYKVAKLQTNKGGNNAGSR